MTPDLSVASTKPEAALVRRPGWLPGQGRGWALALRDSGRETGGHCWEEHLPEDLARLLHAVDEAVDLLGDGVEVEARAVGRGDAQSGHERLAAVVAGADGDALGGEHLRHVVRGGSFDVGGNDPRAPLPGRAGERDPPAP